MPTYDESLGKLINDIIEKKAQGNPAIAETTKAKLILKGLHIDRYANDTPANHPDVLEKLIEIRHDWRVEDRSHKANHNATAHSTKHTEAEAVLEIQNIIEANEVKVLFYFASPEYDQAELARLMEKAFLGAVVIGSSTAGQYHGNFYHEKSVVAMALCPGYIEDAKVEIVTNLEDGVNLKENFNSFSQYFDEDCANMDVDRYIGIALADGLSLKEETIADQIGDLTDVNFIGSSAADGDRYEKTYVYANGKAYENSAVLLLMRLPDNVKYHILSANSKTKREETLVATKVNTKRREVIEFNHMPATKAYAEALGVKEESVSDYFVEHPLGLMFPDNKMMIRSPKEVNGTTITFWCKIMLNNEVALLDSVDIVDSTGKIMDKYMGNLDPKNVRVLTFDSSLRKQELEEKNQLEDYLELHSHYPTIGFFGYGQYYVGFKNQSITSLVLELKNDDEVHKKGHKRRLQSNKYKKIMDENVSLKEENELLKRQLDITIAELRKFNETLAEEIDKRREREDKMAFLSYHDELTGLSNRRFFIETLNTIDTEEKLPLSVIFGDLNNLKTVNDNNGHDCGDELIKKAAQAITLSTRKDDVVVRIGGDEFVVLLPWTNNDQAGLVVSRIQEKLKKEAVAGYPISMALGYQTKNYMDEDIEDIIRQAELYMYTNKKIIQEQQANGE